MKKGSEAVPFEKSHGHLPRSFLFPFHQVEHWPGPETNFTLFFIYSGFTPCLSLPVFLLSLFCIFTKGPVFLSFFPPSMVVVCCKYYFPSLVFVFLFILSLKASSWLWTLAACFSCPPPVVIVYKGFVKISGSHPSYRISAFYHRAASWLFYPQPGEASLDTL